MLTVDLPIQRIRALAEDAAFLDEMDKIYDALEARVAARQPICLNRGACCRFAQYDHSLYVTPVELAYFIARTNFPSTAAATDDATCPYQQSGLCNARQARPTGCRIFFCDPAASEWQPEESEVTLREIKALHQRFQVPYAYIEWLEALRRLADDAASTGFSGRL